MSPICYSDPGMTNANMQFAVVEVDADAPENRNVNPELEVRFKQGFIGAPWHPLLPWHFTKLTNGVFQTCVVWNLSTAVRCI